jgi:predicted metal-dependent hydrolase
MADTKRQRTPLANAGVQSAAAPGRSAAFEQLTLSFDAPPAPSIVFSRHPRARRYMIRVALDGAVRVTIPRWGSKREAAAFAAAQRAWIEKQQRRMDAERLRRARSAASLAIDESVDVSALRDLRARARRELPPRLLELAAQHRLTVSRVSVRNQRTRWGSCSRSGHICLNWRLIAMPEAVREYVMLHELMHLKRMDHSPKFWKLVAGVCPDYQSARRWLRAHRL